MHRWDYHPCFGNLKGLLRGGTWGGGNNKDMLLLPVTGCDVATPPPHLYYIALGSLNLYDKNCKN